MTGHDLRAIRIDLGLTQVEMAAALDVASRSIIRWEQGAYPIPRAIALAVRAMVREAA